MIIPADESGFINRFLQLLYIYILNIKTIKHVRPTVLCLSFELKPSYFRALIEALKDAVSL